MNTSLKSIILILVVLFANRGFCQDYPIPAEDSEWGILTCFGPPVVPGAGCYGSMDTFLIKDTTINNMTYQFWSSVFTRYENNRLLMIDYHNSKEDSIVEVVYYDFNLGVNDSILLPMRGDSVYAIVNEVELFHTINGQSRKRIKLYIDGDITCSYQLDWIEGIGDIESTVLYHCQLGVCDIYSRIVCFSDSSGQIYKEPGFEYPCDSIENYIVLVNNSSNVQSPINLEVHPNPFHDEITIEFPYFSTDKSISIFSTMGVPILETKEDHISTSDLKTGIYFLKIEFESKYYYYKMVKK